MIRSFADKETDRIWNGERSRRLPHDIQGRARDKLVLLEAAETLEDLRNPPSNRLHDLKDDRAVLADIATEVGLDREAFCISTIDMALAALAPRPATAEPKKKEKKRW